MQLKHKVQAQKINSLTATLYLKRLKAITYKSSLILTLNKNPRTQNFTFFKALCFESSPVKSRVS